MALSFLSNKTNDIKNLYLSHQIITDEPLTDAPDFNKYSKRLSQIIVNSKPRFTVGIYGGWGTGKTTMMQTIRDNLNQEKYRDKLETIWFDSWRYEREKYSAMIPLLRTIILTLEKAIVNSNDSKTKALKKIQKGFVKMIKAVISHAELKIEGGIGQEGIAKVGAGLTLDFEKILNDYTSEGNVIVDQEKIYLHKHISDNLKEALENIRQELNVDFRLVIFVDDLDRCTPEKALELLESIKTFFDIEGIIYVIGMDPATIDPIIRSKYGENSKIDGLDYLQKIVQLPFQIPLWNENDLTDSIKEMMKRTELPKDVTEKLLKDEIKNLIINSAKLNPRNIKRFINSLVLSYDIYDQNLKDIDDQNLKDYIIENYLKSMIAIQTFYFRGEKWLQFVKMMMNYNDRIQFLTHFIIFIESQQITSYQDLEDKIKDIPTLKYLKYNKKTLEIYNKIIEIKDEDLFTFLTQAAEPLLKIGKIENYLRAVDTKKDIDITTNTLEIKSYESINKLKRRIQDFNDYVKNSIIHLPYLPYSKLGPYKGNKIPKIDLSKAFLFKADLSGAILSDAILSDAILSGANLSGAILSGANLSGAILPGAILPGAILPGTNLSGAILSGAKLSGATLAKAELSGANLAGAKLREAKLSDAILPGANLSGADLTATNLSGADLTATNLSGTKLVMAILSDANLSGADLTDSILPMANLSHAILTNANLSNANLSGASLSGADLTKANLSGAKLSKTDLINANLSNSIIISPQHYQSLKLNEKTNFANAISDDSNLIYHISQFTQDIPEIVNTKKELKLKLEQRQLGKERIESVLRVSNLPEE